VTGTSIADKPADLYIGSFGFYLSENKEKTDNFFASLFIYAGILWKKTNL